jgi:hypothetical protein
MSTMTQTLTPADLLGLGGSAVSPCAGLDHRTVIGVTPAARVAPFQGTGVPAGAGAARLRPAVQARPEVEVSAWNTVKANTVAHNSIGTTLGIRSSRRPQS